jgi:Outer membrane protein beta-barrel domain
MQDKRIHFNEKFINHAWEDMRKQLEVEMPVRQERRRWLGWWWLACLFLLSAGLGFAAYSKKAANTAAKPTKPIAVGAAPAPNNTANSATPVASPIVPGTQRQPIANTPFKGKNGNSNGEKGNPSFTKNSVKIAESAAVNELITSDGAPFVASQEMTAMPAVALSDASQTMPENLDLLGAVELKNLAHPSVIPTVASQQMSLSKWRLAIEGTMMRALDRPATGVSAHLLASRPLKMSNLSLQVGLGYTFVQQPLGVELAGNSIAGGGNSDEVLVYYGNDFDREGLSSISGSAVRTRYKQGLNLNYLTVPVRLAYSIGNRFTVKMGLEGGLLMASKSDFTNSGFLSNIIQKADEAVDPTFNDKSNSGAIKLASLDFAAIGGIDFRLSPRFSIGTQFKLGLKDIMPLNSIREYNRLLQLGLTYHLAKRK